MKKIYTLALLIPFAFAFGQNLAQNGGMEAWTNDVLDVWTSEAGTEISKETAIKSEGNFAAKFKVVTTTQGNTDFRQAVALESGKVYEVSVDVYQLDNLAQARLYAGGYRAYSDEKKVNEWQTLTYEYTTSAAGDVQFGLRFYNVKANWADGDDTKSSNIIIDNFIIKEKGSASVAEVANIAELRAGTIGEIYKLTGEAVLTMQQTFRGQKWIQDSTAGILIDDTSGAITTTYNIYDGITGIEGKLGEYNGVMQFVPTKDTGAASSTANNVTPKVVTVTDLVNSPNNYESQLVVIENISTAAQGVWEPRKNYKFKNEANEEVTVRTNFKDADLINTDLPQGAVSVAGVASEFQGKGQVFPRFLSDISTMSINEIGAIRTDVKIAVANGAIYFSNFKADKVEVYNSLGQKVSESLNVGNLSKGIYFLKAINAKGEIVQGKFIK